MNSDNIVKLMSNSSNYITKNNRLFKNIKSDTKADYIWLEKSGIIIVTDKAVFSLDFQTIEKYIKNLNQIDFENVEFSQLPQSKSYLKIIGLSYFIENMTTSLTSDVVKTILKNNHITS